jgi:hypothetical protein
MNSHERRVYNRSWRRDHPNEVAEILSFLGSPKRYVISHVRTDGVIEMREQATHTLMGTTLTREGWKKFLSERGVIDIVV